MKTTKKSNQTKKRLAEKEAEIQVLKRDIQGLQKKSQLQEAVLETIESVNTILAADDQGKQLLWTTNFPHNLKPEIAEKIQQAVKKKPLSGDTNNTWEYV